MNRVHPSDTRRRRRFFPRALQLSIGGAMALTAFGQDAGRMDKLETENKALRDRLDKLETMAKKEGIVPSGTESSPVAALSKTTLSGFVTASYFYNFNSPADRTSDGYLWNTRDNQFTLNKFKITLASPPVERSGEKWDAGYRASLIFGQDAWAVNTGGTAQGFDELREAYVELNAPIGTGLNIKAGHLISLLNYESGDGGAANNNFSQGYQWWYTGNGPGTGIQLGYTFTDWMSLNVRVQNGMFSGPNEGNDPKTVIGSLNLKPTKDLWVNLIGFGGAEPAFTLTGGSVLAGYQVTKEFNAGLEIDYFSYDVPGVKSNFDTWSVGTFLSYDLSETFALGLRAEYLDDPGRNIPAIGHFNPTSTIGQTSPATENGDLASIALTLNYKPVKSVKIQPEVRYDMTSYTKGFDGHGARFIVGAGITYMF
jgi:hypothetical protein